MNDPALNQFVLETFLKYLIPLLAFAIIVCVAAHFGFKNRARSHSSIDEAELKNAEQRIHKIVPSTIWLPIYVKILSSPEIVVRWNSHFLLVSTAALAELTPDEFAFLVTSERRHLKMFQQKYLIWIMLLIVIPPMIPMSIPFLTRRPFLALTFLGSFFSVAFVLPLAHWAREHADKWRPVADAETVAEIANPQAAITAVQKSIGSVVADSKQTPYQRSMARLEVVENAARKIFAN